MIADQARASLGDSVRRKAIEAAEVEVFDYRIVIIAAEQWEMFEGWARSPAKEVSALTKLAASRPVWQD